MKCTVQDCPGRYDTKTVIHPVRHAGRVIVFDHVPAEVCSVCGDVLLRPETIRQIEKLLSSLPQPDQVVPLFEYA